MHAQQQQQQQMHAQQQQQQQQQQMHAQQKQQQQQQMHAQQHHFHPPLFQYQGQQAAQFSAGPIPYPTAQQPSFPHLTPASNNHATSIHYSQQQPPQHLYPSQHSHHPAHY
jgi:type II secretory pathway pseudopilin PulG